MSTDLTTLDDAQLADIAGGDALSCVGAVIRDTVIGGGGSAVIGGVAGAVLGSPRNKRMALGARLGAAKLGKYGAGLGALIGVTKCF